MNRDTQSSATGTRIENCIENGKESCKENCDVESCAKALKLLRIQRHNFINHLQVIHSMIQLGRGENALGYIDKIAKDACWIAGIVDEYNKGRQNF